MKRLNIDLETQSARYESDRICEIRIVLLNYMLNKRIIVALMAFIAISIFFCSIEFVGIILTVIIMFYVFILYYPQIKEQQNYSDINQELPYALRHMGIELKAGKGLHDSMITIRDAEYGSLSREFNRALEEIKFGKSTEDALLDMSHRIKSQGLSIAIQQIISTLRVGGNLSNSLNIIAKDITFDMNIKLKEYSQKLNSFILIYTFIAILAPTIALVMLMAGSTVIGDVISSNLLLTIYTLFFPIIIIFMGVFIKKLEPKI
ncbi:type II secretion system F family protein [Methanobrevibacter sp.]|uniref:type II secretion system F family protein n=1 Tax=Methanobrevibacter sp. TaxID=66852 RepID=UPI0025FFA2DA|nr:type II secretion system F family protein [Methanobrevibacter sp.]